MAFAPSKGKKHRTVTGGVSLTSLMDAMTIILLFLLNQFSAEGALVTESEGLRLPESINLEKPKKTVTISISTMGLLVDENPVASPEEYTGPVDPNTGYVIQKLADVLEPLADELIDLGDGPDGEPLFKGEILIQGDRSLEYTTFLKVVVTAAQAGFNKIKLITVEGA